MQVSVGMCFPCGHRAKRANSLCGQKDPFSVLCPWWALLRPLFMTSAGPESRRLWGQRELGVVTMAHSACPAPLRPDNQGPLVTRACRPHGPRRDMPEEKQLTAIISLQLLWILIYF